jgi:hypothetical protein
MFPPFLYQSLTHCEMYMVALTQSQPDWQTGIDADRGTGSDIKVTTTEIASDSGSFLLCEVAWTFAGTKC